MFQLVGNRSVNQRKVVTLKKVVTLPFAQRLYKGFFKNHTNELQEVHTERGAIRCPCLVKQAWEIKTQCNFSYVFLHLCFSPASPCLSTSLINTLSLEETNSQTEKVSYLLHSQRLTILLIV